METRFEAITNQTKIIREYKLPTCVRWEDEAGNQDDLHLYHIYFFWLRDEVVRIHP